MPQENPIYLEEHEVEVLDSTGYVLIVWNDDINTFDWVIKTLIEVCKHEPEQAEQCAMIVHFKGIGATVEELK
jgi:ATP-dependent Clp protease adaptor protein ClpS